MERRQFTALLGGCLLAGCNVQRPSSGDTSTPTSSPDSTPRSNATTRRSRSARLVVLSSADGALRVTLTLAETPSDRTVYERTRTLESGDVIRLDGYLEPGQNYWFTLEVDDTTVFERKIYSYQGYEVTVRSETTAEVTALAER